MIRYFALILLSFAFFYSASYGAELDYIGDVGASAKTISIGNVEGFSNSAASVFENPASLCLAKDFSVSLLIISLYLVPLYFPKTLIQECLFWLSYLYK